MRRIWQLESSTLHLLKAAYSCREEYVNPAKRANKPTLLPLVFHHSPFASKRGG